MRIILLASLTLASPALALDAMPGEDRFAGLLNLKNRASAAGWV